MKRILFALAFLTSTASAKVPPAAIAAFPGTVIVQVDLGVEFNSGATDVLFVVDDSASMETHQSNLSRNIPILVDGLINSNLDFHAGVITTSNDNNGINSGRGRLFGNFKVIERSTPNAAASLSQNLRPGTSGSGYETPFDTIKLALSEPLLSNENAGFFRGDANLAIILVTDAEDQSQTSVANLTSFLQGLKTNRTITVQAMNVPTGVNDCTRDDPGATPIRIEELLKNFGGAEFSLCAPNFPGQVKQITDNVIAAAGKGTGMPTVKVSRVPLPSVPSFKTIRVTFGSEVLAGGDSSLGWIFDRAKNEIVLGTDIDWGMQPKGTLLNVSYVPADWK